jgi:signal transduction histidine kinase
VLGPEASALLQLHTLTGRLLGTKDVAAALHEVLDAAIALQGADFGDVHRLDASSGTLRLAAQRGLPEAYLAACAEVDKDHFSACGRALRTGQAVIIEDVELDDDYTSMRPLARQTGYRAVQAKPLTARSGQLLGVLSVHFRGPCRPSQSVLRMLDLYARQAADVIERLQDQDRLRAAYEGKKRFVAMLAHDLRGPLAAVRNAIELLARPQLPREIHEQAVGIARRQLGQAVQLVDELLDLARLTESKLRLQKHDVSMNDVVQRALDVSEPQMTAAGVTLQVNIEPQGMMVFVDPPRFAQVLANLLSNASKFTPAKGHVHLTCRASPESVMIEVADTGIGMTRDTLSRVFDAFEQADEELDNSRGLGLGLPIAKRIVEMHGGEITAQSDGPGHGSTFRIDLPRQCCANAAQEVRAVGQP